MAEVLQNIKEASLPEITIILKSNGIVYVTLLKNQTLDVALQMKMVECYNQVTNGKLTPFLFEAEDGVTITPEARHNATLLEEIVPVKALALVVNSLPYAMVANFYLKFNKPKRPSKVFKTKVLAIEWLEQFL